MPCWAQPPRTATHGRCHGLGRGERPSKKAGGALRAPRNCISYIERLSRAATKRSIPLETPANCVNCSKHKPKWMGEARGGGNRQRSTRGISKAGLVPDLRTTLQLFRTVFLAERRLGKRAGVHGTTPELPTEDVRGGTATLLCRAVASKRNKFENGSVCAAGHSPLNRRAGARRRPEEGGGACELTSARQPRRCLVHDRTLQSLSSARPLG